jgi:hypothetical protein
MDNATAQAKNVWNAAAKYIREKGFTVSTHVPRDVTSRDINAQTRFPDLKIWVRPEFPEDRKARLLLHEIGHAATGALAGGPWIAQMLLHEAAQEYIAESVSWQLAKQWHINNDAEAKDYIDSWAEGAAPEQLEELDREWVEPIVHELSTHIIV